MSTNRDKFLGWMLGPVLRHWKTVMCEEISYTDHSQVIALHHRDSETSRYHSSHVLYKTRRDKTWQFVFTDSDLELLRRRKVDRIALLCGDDGVCAITIEQVHQIIKDMSIQNPHVTVIRPKGGGYRVRSSEGFDLPHVIRKNAFVTNLFNKK